MAQTEYTEEFKFPDEASDESSAKPVETSGKPDSDNFEIEIEDDTPPEDRGRKPAVVAPEEPADDELASYDEKVQARFKKFTKGYHDERRAKEQAIREREAAESYARQVIEENKRLQQQMATSTQALVAQAKTSAQLELETAEKRHKEAYESGDSEALAKAQVEIAKAVSRLERVQNIKPLQPQQNSVQPAQQSNAPRITDRDQRWLQSNSWFGTDPEMTATALGLHQKLERTQGAQFIGSNEYYKIVDATIKRRFPEYFSGSEDTDDSSNKTSDPAEEGEPQRRAPKPAAVVAPATRSTPPNRIRLKASEASIAKRLGVPLEEYAKQVAQLRRNG